MHFQQNPKLQDKVAFYSTSNTELLKMIQLDTTSTHNEIEETFKNDKFRKKIKSLLKYYEPRQQSENQSVLVNKKFFNNCSMNDIFKEIIIKVSDCLVRNYLIRTLI